MYPAQSLCLVLEVRPWGSFWSSHRQPLDSESLQSLFHFTQRLACPKGPWGRASSSGLVLWGNASYLCWPSASETVDLFHCSLAPSCTCGCLRMTQRLVELVHFKDNTDACLTGWSQSWLGSCWAEEVLRKTMAGWPSCKNQTCLPNTCKHPYVVLIYIWIPLCSMATYNRPWRQRSIILLQNKNKSNFIYLFSCLLCFPGSRT